MILNELVSKQNSNMKVILYRNGEDVALTPRILANCGRHEVLEIGIIGESMVDIADNGYVEARTTGKQEMPGLHVMIGEPVTLTGIFNGCSA